MLVYSYFWLQNIESLNLSGIISAFKMLFLGYFHLWYLPGTIGAALILYLLKDLKDRWIIILACLAFFVGLGIQYAGNYHWVENTSIDNILNKIALYRNFLLFGFPFFAMGYFFRKYKLQETISLRVLFYSSILGIICLLIESYFGYLYADIATKAVDFDLFLSLLILCPAVFLLAFKIHTPGESKNIALVSSAIYFIHPLFLSFIPQMIPENIPINTILLTLVILVFSALSTLVLIRLNQRLRCVL